jgi:hypothetical protein
MTLSLAQAAQQQALAEGYQFGPTPTLNNQNVNTQASLGNTLVPVTEPVPYYPPATNTTPNLGLSLQGLDPVEAENMVILDTGFGTGLGPFNSSGLGGFFSDGKLTWVPTNSTGVIGGSVNGVRAVQFSLVVPQVIGRCTPPEALTAGAAGTTFGFAIYNSAKNLVVSATGFDATNVSTGQSKTFTNTLLPIGIYYFAWTQTDISTFTMPQYGVSDLRQMFGSVAGSGYIRMGNASNSATAGVFPSSLGTLDGGALGSGYPLVFWEAQ